MKKDKNFFIRCRNEKIFEVYEKNMGIMSKSQDQSYGIEIVDPKKSLEKTYIFTKVTQPLEYDIYYRNSSVGILVNSPKSAGKFFFSHDITQNLFYR